MGAILEKLTANFVKETLDQSDKYYLFESTLKKPELFNKLDYSIYIKRYKYVRRYINDSLMLKFIMMMVLINPFFKFISFCK